MKLTSKLVTILFLVLTAFCYSQNRPTCSNFHITNIVPNPSNPSELLVSVHYDANAYTFISNPFVKVLKNLNDTIAYKNSWSFYGQQAGTVIDYTIPLLSGTTYTPGNTYTAEFVYNYLDDVTGLATYTCYLNFLDTYTCTPYINVYTEELAICSGGADFEATLYNAGTNPILQWKKNGINVGTGDEVYTASALTNGDIITCELTSNLACATPSNVTSASITMTVGSVNPQIHITADDTSLACGEIIAFNAEVTGAGPYPTYIWKKNGINVNDHGNSFDPSDYETGSLLNGDVITCELISSFSCATPTSVISLPITVTVTAASPTINISALETEICSGTTLFAANSFGAIGSNYILDWRKNNISTGVTTRTYQPISLTDGDVIDCILTSDLACASPTNVLSSSITMTVGVVHPSITISSNIQNNTLNCGQYASFYTNVHGAGDNPIYQWKLNGLDVGNGSSSFDVNNVITGDIITCTLISDLSCANPATVVSTPITVSVVPLPPSISIHAEETAICSGTTLFFAQTGGAIGDNKIIEWHKNGINMGVNTQTYSPISLANGDIVTCELTSDLACATPSSILSAPITMTVGVVNPQITVSASNLVISCGDNVSFEAIYSGAGDTPTFQWKKNGVDVGNGSDNYSLNNLLNGDVITCELISSLACATPSSIVSNPLTVTVTTSSPSITITAEDEAICFGATDFSSEVNGAIGSNPIYQWKKNGINVGTGLSTYSPVLLLNGDVITCTIKSNLACASPSTALSNAITMTVGVVHPQINIQVNNPVISCGDLAYFEATLSGGGANPILQWKKNGVNVGDGSEYYEASDLVNGDVITCELASSFICATPNSVVSNSIMITVGQVAPTVDINASTTLICPGSSVDFYASAEGAVGDNPFFRWYKNGVNTGVTGDAYSSNTLVNGDKISCRLTSDLACATPSSVVSNTVIMIVETIVPTVTLTSNITNVCRGSAVSFSTTSTNAGSSPFYQWKRNGFNVGTNTPTLTTVFVTNGDKFSVTMTSNAGCANTAPAKSNSITMAVTPTVVASVTLTANTTTICNGMAVSFTTNPTNGGTNPSYQWLRNGAVVGANTPSLTTTFVNNNDKFLVKMTSNATCPSPTTSISNTITMNVGVCTDVEDITNTPNEVIVYPNPAKNELYVKLNDIEQYPISMELYNTNGQLVKKEIVENENAQISLLDVSDGLYIVKLSNAVGFKGISKLVVQK